MSFQLSAAPRSWCNQARTTATLNPPTINAWVTVLNLTQPCRASSLIIQQTNTETAAKNIEVEYTIDGIAIPAHTVALADTNPEYVYALNPLDDVEHTLNQTDGGLLQQYYNGTPISEGLTVWLECHHQLLIRIRIVTALGTAQTLTYTIRHDLLLPVGVG